MAISQDLRDRILAASLAREGTRQQLADRFKVSLGFVKKLISQHKSLGHVHNLYARVGRKRVLSEDQEKRLGDLARENPSMTLAEYREALGVKCSLPTIDRALRRLKLSYKKNSKTRGAEA